MKFFSLGIFHHSSERWEHFKLIWKYGLPYNPNLVEEPTIIEPTEKP